eukprot:gene3978-3890_t
MAAACLYPVLSAFQLAGYDWSMGTPWASAQWVGWDNVIQAFANPRVWNSLLTTLLFAAVCVTAEMLLGIALALALEKPVKGMSFFRTLFILPMMIAPIAVGLTWRYIFDAQFGLANAVLKLLGLSAQTWLADPQLAFMAIVIADIWQWTPFVFIMMIAALAGVDHSVIEAARIDGASWWQQTLWVKLPMVMHVIAITLMMRLIDAFRVLEVIYVLTFGGPGDSTEILALHIYKTAFVGQQLGVAAAISILLLLVVTVLSLGALLDIFAEPLNFIFMPTLENYRAVIEEDKLDRYLGNSLFVGIVSTVITLVLGCMAAYGLARFRFPGRQAVAYTTLLLRTVPLAVLAIPVFLIWNEWQLVNSLWGLVLLYVAVNLPFTIWLLYGFVLQVPIELEEAAAIDGCGPFQIFTKVLLPLMGPGLAAASIFTFRIAWNEFILALVLTDRQTRTLPVAASLFITDLGVDWGKVMAMTSLIAIPPLIFTFIAARQIITGLTAGAVKG